MDKYFRHIEDNFFTSEECKGFIILAENIGFEEAKIQTKGVGEVMNKGVRDNDRVIYDNPQLAQQLWSIIKPLVPAEVEGYNAVGLNEKFRFYRYKDGQQFKVHPDGSFKRDEFEHSKITAIIYLNEDFTNGQTVFVNPYQEVDPQTGRLLLFAHGQLHKGNEVPEGTKYVLRTDVMYRREPLESEITEPVEVLIGEMEKIFKDMNQEESSAELKRLATEWNLKGYMIATGKISENKMHELWAIKKPLESANDQ